MAKLNDNWNSENSYEYFMGRWGNLIAEEFINWLVAPKGLRWIDLGCGTGALSEAICKICKPSKLLCVDPSEQFLERAKKRLPDFAETVSGISSGIPATDKSYDFTVSGLALNFFPDHNAALTEMKRVTVENGTVSAYVWDYAGKMEFLRYFWDAAAEIDPAAKTADEGNRFPVCSIDNLVNLFQKSGLKDIEDASLDIKTVFKNFDDFWNPFLGGQGPAPGYLLSLSEAKKNELKKLLHKNLPVNHDGTIQLTAGAFAVKGRT